MTKTEELQSALAAKGLRYVGTRGDTKRPICFVGEAPGADEDQQGTPFVGASGRELDRMLGETSIGESDCWFTNPYKTRPPDNKLDRLSEFGIPDSLFLEQFFEELNAYKPTFICPLGATPLGILCPFTINPRTGTSTIGSYRGSILRSPLLTWEHYVVPSFHPAFLFRSWDERQNAVLCLAKLKEEFDYWQQHSTLQPLPQRKLISDPSADDTIDFLRRLLSSPNTPVSVDIENIGIYKGDKKYKTPKRKRVPYVIGLGNDINEAWSIGLAEYERPKAIQIWQLIDQVLRECVLVGQNADTHDLPWLEYVGFSPLAIRRLHDTLVRHHVLWPELSHKLEYQTFQYTREPYYKDEGKNWSVKERQTMKKYNCKDVAVTLEIYYAQEKEFNERP